MSNKIARLPEKTLLALTIDQFHKMESLLHEKDKALYLKELKRKAKKGVGRSKAYSPMEEAWVIQHLGLDPNDPDLTKAVSKARNRPSQLLAQRIKEATQDPKTNPNPTRFVNEHIEIFRKELSSRYAIGCVVDDTERQAFFVELLTINSKQTVAPLCFSYTDANKTEKFNEASSYIHGFSFDEAMLDSPFHMVRGYLDVAKKAIDENKKFDINGDYWNDTERSKYPNRVGFALAIAYLKTAVKNERCLISWNTTNRSLLNCEMPPNDKTYNWKLFFENCAEKFAMKDPTSTGGRDPNVKVVTKGTVREKMRQLGLAVHWFKKTFSLKHYPSKDQIKEWAEEAKNSVNKAHKLPKSKPHEHLSRKGLRIVFKHAYDTDVGIYLRTMLELSTGIRPTESDNISSSKLDGDKISVDYVAKTENKVDIRKLPSASTSILTRVILKHYDWSNKNQRNNQELVNFWSKSKSPLRQILREQTGDEIYERCLRTTVATMLCEAIASENCKKIGYQQVKERLAHTTLNRTLDTYAKHRPKDANNLSTDEYFFSEIAIPEFTTADGKKVAGNEIENAWDLYLLVEFMERMDYENNPDLQKWISDEIRGKAAFTLKTKSVPLT